MPLRTSKDVSHLMNTRLVRQKPQVVLVVVVFAECLVVLLDLSYSFECFCELITELDLCCSSHKASSQVDLYLKEHEHLTK